MTYDQFLAFFGYTDSPESRAEYQRSGSAQTYAPNPAAPVYNTTSPSPAPGAFGAAGSPTGSTAVAPQRSLAEGQAMLSRATNAEQRAAVLANDPTLQAWDQGQLAREQSASAAKVTRAGTDYGFLGNAVNRGVRAIGAAGEAVGAVGAGLGETAYDTTMAVADPLGLWSGKNLGDRAKSISNTSADARRQVNNAGQYTVPAQPAQSRPGDPAVARAQADARSNGFVSPPPAPEPSVRNTNADLQRPLTNPLGVTDREKVSLDELNALRQRVEGQYTDPRVLADQGLAQQIAAARSTGGTAAQRAGAGFAASQNQPLIAAQATDAAARANAANSGLLAEVAGQKTGVRSDAIGQLTELDKVGVARGIARADIDLKQAQTRLTEENTEELQRRYELARDEYNQALSSGDEGRVQRAYGLLTTLGAALGSMVGGAPGGALGGAGLAIAGNMLGVDAWL